MRRRGGEILTHEEKGNRDPVFQHAAHGEIVARLGERFPVQRDGNMTVALVLLETSEPIESQRAWRARRRGRERLLEQSSGRPLSPDSNAYAAAWIARLWRSSA